MIGERLAELRKLNGETQEDLAKAFHVSVPTVRTWERDKASPSHEVLIALCKRYGTSADYLLGLTDYILPAMGPAGFWIGFIIGLTAAAILMVLRIRWLQKQPTAFILQRAAH